MSLLYRAFGKAQDTVTRALYGAEKTTTKMSFYSCADNLMGGEEAKVCKRIHTVPGTSLEKVSSNETVFLTRTRVSS